MGSSIIRSIAPEIHCNQRTDQGHSMYLEGAHFSDSGHAIISMFFDATVGTKNAAASDERFQMTLSENPQPGRIRSMNGIEYQHHYEYANMCKDRIVDGVARSGMGDIFRVIANI